MKRLKLDLNDSFKLTGLRSIYFQRYLFVFLAYSLFVSNTWRRKQYLTFSMYSLTNFKGQIFLALV